VTNQESTIDQAIQGAIHKLKKSIEGAFGKRPPGIISGIITRHLADGARAMQETTT